MIAFFVGLNCKKIRDMHILIHAKTRKSSCLMCQRLEVGCVRRTQVVFNVRKRWLQPASQKSER